MYLSIQSPAYIDKASDIVIHECRQFGKVHVGYRHNRSSAWRRNGHVLHVNKT